VLFVLRELLTGPLPTVPERVCALAFGPGLTVETALLTLGAAA
jgi:predicted naringenin-chalcone synthase